MRAAVTESTVSSLLAAMLLISILVPVDDPDDSLRAGQDGVEGVSAMPANFGLPDPGIDGICCVGGAAGTDGVITAVAGGVDEVVARVGV
jgi:hypothetical protein